VLDGQPTQTRGQSLVELAITAPIFLIMLTGLVEVGWYANNFLIISDVVRSAGRFGSLRDPLEWVEGQEKNYEFLDCNVDSPDQGYPGENTYNLVPPGNIITAPPSMGAGFFDGGESADLGYYDGVACSAIINMAPLIFDVDRDDIIVSVFSYVRLQTGCTNGITPCIRISGRFPTNQNECSSDSRDPFDVDDDGAIDNFERFYNDLGVELPYFDAATNEGYRGYVLRANHIPEDDASCRGSDFSLDRVEEMLNKTLIKTDTALDATTVETSNLENGGLILVEMSWQSDQLLGLPFFIWLPNPIEVGLWGMFPVPAAEPDLDCTGATCTKPLPTTPTP
jgi:hypothetical protein